MLHPVTFPVALQLPGVPDELKSLVYEGYDAAAVARHSGALARWYGLYAVVVHRGQSATAGHYYAFGRRSGAAGLHKADCAAAPWAKFNDAHVSAATWAEIQRTVSASVADSAYLLFYRRLSPAEAQAHLDERAQAAGAGAADVAMGGEDDEDALLAAALAMSAGGGAGGGGGAGAGPAPETPGGFTPFTPGGPDDDDDEMLLAKAMAMSMSSDADAAADAAAGVAVGAAPPAESGEQQGEGDAAAVAATAAAGEAAASEEPEEPDSEPLLDPALPPASWAADVVRDNARFFTEEFDQWASERFAGALHRADAAGLPDLHDLRGVLPTVLPRE